ncbi:MAG TPA: hypothetical protein ENJ19_07385 [Gammaproteobacteria bacterium]|nr:hypothetical protein [Gammaproteobacteria bacterium]
MSGTQYYSARAGRGAQATRNLSDNMQTLAAAARAFFGTATEIQSAVVNEFLGTFNIKPGRRAFKGSCDFPEPCRPDTHVGRLVRSAYPGECVRIPVKFRNATGKPREFDFRAEQPLVNSRGEQARPLKLSRTTVRLLPEQSGMTVLSVDLDDAFRTGYEYATDIIIVSEGCEPQRLKIVINVQSDDACPVIKLGCPCDPPLRPLRWYHHYYCDQPRAERTPQKPGGERFARREAASSTAGNKPKKRKAEE